MLSDWPTAVESHMAENQGPFAHVRPHPYNGMRGANGHTGTYS
jgi:hypothetical protein